MYLNCERCGTSMPAVCPVITPYGLAYLCSDNCVRVVNNGEFYSIKEAMPYRIKLEEEGFKSKEDLSQCCKSAMAQSNGVKDQESQPDSNA